MKIQVVLKFILNLTFQSNETKTVETWGNWNSKSLSTGAQNKEEEVHEFSFPDANKSLITIAELKKLICVKLHFNFDSLQLFIKKFEFIELNDTDNISIITEKSPYSLGNVICLYYKWDKDLVKVKIDFYQMQVEKIYLKWSRKCSILMLKHVVAFKLGNTLTVSSQKLFGVEWIDIKNKNKFPKNNQNEEYLNSQRLTDCLNAYGVPNVNHDKQSFVLHMLLIRNEDNKLQMGLNFKFNYFKNITKITFNQSAPSHCECTDGINLFSYCRNANCQIYNQLFVTQLGYGCFDIIKYSSNISCPFCLSNKLIEVKNIGLINSKWYYKGIVHENKRNTFEGDGITTDNKLYLLQETKITSMLNKLVIDARRHLVQKSKTFENWSFKDEEEEDLEDMNWCWPDCLDELNRHEKSKIKMNWTLVNNTKIQNARIIDNESDVQSMDVFWDRNENIVCNECMIGENIMENLNECIIL